MSKSLEDATLKWVRDNCPRAAMLDPGEALEVVRRVLAETGTVRRILSVAGSFAGGFAGLWLAEYWSVSENSRALYFGTIVLGGILVGMLSTAAGQTYLHRKLEEAFQNAW